MLFTAKNIMYSDTDWLHGGAKKAEWSLVMNKLHYAEITKDCTNKRGTLKKEVCHLGGVSPTTNISIYN